MTLAPTDTPMMIPCVALSVVAEGAPMMGAISVVTVGADTMVACWRAGKEVACKTARRAAVEAIMPVVGLVIAAWTFAAAAVLYVEIVDWTFTEAAVMVIVTSAGDTPALAATAFRSAVRSATP